MWATALLGDSNTTFEIANGRLDKGLLLDIRPLWHPLLETLRAQPEFIDLMYRLGYVDYWEAVGWSDVCRSHDDELVCDSAALTPERLREILAGETSGQGELHLPD